MPEFDVVSYDGLTGAEEATRHLLELGHTKIAFIGDTKYPWYQQRYEGYARAMEKAGMAPRKIDLEVEQTSVEDGSVLMRDLAKRSDRPTAIFAGNDVVAYCLWRGMVENGLSVPRDMSLMGFDDREEGLLVRPPLTTVYIPKEEIGMECARILLEKIKYPGKKIPSVVMPTRLVVRESTASP
jgi:LacI family transcriptional regulator